MTARRPHSAQPADLQEAARRSTQYGIDPWGMQSLSLGDLGEAAERLADLSDPVFRPILDQLTDANIGVVLADHRGNIALRGAGTRDVAGVMDQHALAVGYSLAEDRVGTNGVGTSLVTKRPAVVVGADHYLEVFKSFSCVHSPVIHPVSHRIAGAVGLVCPVTETSPLLLPTAMQLAQAIEERLLRDASPSDRLLLDGFVRRRRNRNASIVALNDSTWIATPIARDRLAEYDHETVWRHVERSQFTKPVVIGGRNGRVVKLELVDLLDERAAVFEVTETTLEPHSVTSRGVTSEPQLAGLIGQSVAWQQVVQKAVAVSRVRQPLVICGEFGTGRCAIAQSIAQRAGSEFAVFDSGTVALEGAKRWLGAIEHALLLPQVVVVRDVDSLDDPIVGALTSFARRPHPARVILTMPADDSMSDQLAHLRSLIPLSIMVPPLRSRPEDIEPIARHHLAAAGRTTVSERFFTALRRRPWTGNVSGLLATLDSALDLARHGPLDASHLPPPTGTARTGIGGTIQQAEESAIRRALAQAGGNRTEAAESLGISRATLYRRLRTYGLD